MGWDEPMPDRLSKIVRVSFIKSHLSREFHRTHDLDALRGRWDGRRPASTQAPRPRTGSPIRQVERARLTAGSPHRFLGETQSARQTDLTEAGRCSTFVLMEVETLGIARSLGWRVHMRCSGGYREGTKSIRRCGYRKQLDLDTLVCTRGPNFPLSRLESRLMCPACGSRIVTVVFEPPTNREVRSRWLYLLL
jgi:hypothetical protein